MEAKNKRILFGCLGGCGLMLLLVVGSCVTFTVWLNTPGEVLEPQVLLGADTSGYVEWTLRLEDPGTAALVESLIEHLDAINRRSNSPLPGGLGEFFSDRQRKGMERDMQKLFPIVVAWTMNTEGRDDEHLFTVSARGASHQMMLLDWIAGFFIGRVPEIDTVKHARDRIYLLPPREDGHVRYALFIRKGIVFVTNGVKPATRALDRITAAAQGGGEPSGIDGLFASLPADSALRGAVGNTDGALLRVLDALSLPDEYADPELWADVRGAIVSGKFADGDTFSGAVELVGPDAAWAQASSGTLGTAIETMLGATDVDFELSTAAVQDRVRVSFAAKRILDQIEIPEGGI